MTANHRFRQERVSTTSNRTTERVVPRVVLDTSTVIMPVFRPGSKHRWLRDAWHDGRITPLISDDTEREFQRTLRAPRHRVPAHRIPELARDYLDYCIKAAITEPILPTPECRDPKDQPFLDLAYNAGVDYLVARDQDLLVIRDDSLVPIIEPETLQLVLLHSR